MLKGRKMDERKRLILKQIVSHYIKSGEPVSSRTVLEHYNPGVSSATIRNDMRYMEEQGYIAKPYCSAGRVPTEKGYRFFVDWLLELAELAHQDQHALIEYYRFPRQDLERLLRQTAFLLANVTGLVGFVLAPGLEETHLERITLVPLGSDRLLVVLVSELGLVESQVVEARLSPGELEEVKSLLNLRLRGQPFGAILAEVRQFFQLEGREWVEPELREAFAILSAVLSREGHRRLHIEGLLNLMEALLRQPRGAEQLGVVKLLSDERRFAEFLREVAREGEVRALIGRENPLPELRHWSVITMGYGFGVLGGLGPLRMDYSRAFSATRYIGNRLRAILSSAREEVKD